MDETSKLREELGNNLLHNWFLFHGATIALSLTNAKVTATKPFSMCGGRYRMGGVAIRF